MCIRDSYIADPRPENMPLLEDLYDEIKRQPEPEAQRIAAALELYVQDVYKRQGQRSAIWNGKAYRPTSAT